MGRWPGPVGGQLGMFNWAWWWVLLQIEKEGEGGSSFRAVQYYGLGSVMAWCLEYVDPWGSKILSSISLS